MLAALGFILLLLLVVVAGPLAGMLLGAGFVGSYLWACDRLSDALDHPPMTRGGKENGINLPGALLAARRRDFRVEGHEGADGRIRVYLVPAKHAGAAVLKARHWGMRIRQVTEISQH